MESCPSLQLFKVAFELSTAFYDFKLVRGLLSKTRCTKVVCKKSKCKHGRIMADDQRQQTRHSSPTKTFQTVTVWNSVTNSTLYYSPELFVSCLNRVALSIDLTDRFQCPYKISLWMGTLTLETSNISLRFSERFHFPKPSPYLDLLRFEGVQIETILAECFGKWKASAVQGRNRSLEEDLRVCGVSAEISLV